MPLIDTSYFEVYLVISSLSNPPIAADVNLHITTYEPQLLRKLLGSSLYEAFLAGLAANDGYFAPPGAGEQGFDSVDFNTTGVIEDRWEWLRSGHTYVINSCSVYWPGFVNAEKKSVIANYVYYWFRRNRVSTTSSVGEVVGATENSNIISPASKMVQAWNEMVTYNRSLVRILCETTIYPEFNRREVDYSVFERINQFNI